MRWGSQSWLCPEGAHAFQAARPAGPLGTGKIAQYRIVFGQMRIRHNSWGGPLVRAGRPRPALLSTNQVATSLDKPTRGSAADRGVRPTTNADVRKWESYMALGKIACPTK
jgi:hypothetical protein